MNEEGRGLFDEINDICEKSIVLNKNGTRLFSSSMVFKSNENKKYRYYINFESYNLNFELLDIETGELTVESSLGLTDISSSTIGMAHIDYPLSWTQMTKLKEENQMMLNFYSYIYIDDNLSSYELRFWQFNFKLNQNRKTKDGKINVYSLESLDFVRFYNVPFKVNKRFYTINIGKDLSYISIILENNYIYLIKIYYSSGWKIKYYKLAEICEDNFHRLLFIKENIFLFAFNSNQNPPYYNYIEIYIGKHLYDVNKFTILIGFPLRMYYKEGRYIQYTDIIILSENKVALVALKWHGRAITIYILDFNDNYT